VHRINIDNDGDNLADVAFTFVFSEYQDGRQTGTAWYATGAEARQPEPAGEVLAAGIPVSFDGMAQPVQVNGILLAAGWCSDPFFADVEGALHGFAWTGHDDFAGNNVDSIALEVPAAILGGRVIGVWTSITRRRDDGTLEQLDRGGNPTINPVINPDGQKNLFNSRQPAHDMANYLEPWSAILENVGGYTPEAAWAAALQVLPDILHSDRTKPATYPNGRVPTDDVASLRYAWLTNGKVPPSGLKPHDDLLAASPTSARLTPDRSGWSPPRRRAGHNRRRRGAHRDPQANTNPDGARCLPLHRSQSPGRTSTTRCTGRCSSVNCSDQITRPPTWSPRRSPAPCGGSEPMAAPARWRKSSAITPTRPVTGCAGCASSLPGPACQTARSRPPPSSWRVRRRAVHPRAAGSPAVVNRI
jgi:hypothetical protein